MSTWTYTDTLLLRRSLLRREIKRLTELKHLRSQEENEALKEMRHELRRVNKEISTLITQPPLF